MASDEPRTPLAAVVHPDPYPYYARLVDARPFYRDAELNLWVAASAEAVAAVLDHPDLRVRPPASPVPAAIVGSPAGTIFARLARMTDGDDHAAVKPALEAALSADGARAVAAAAGELARPILAAAAGADLRRLAFEVPVGALALVLGTAAADVPRVTGAVAAFVGCIPAGAAPAAIEAADRGAAELLAAYGPVVARAATGPAHALAQNRAANGDPSVVLANTIGLLSQTFDATAGLIGNTLVALARRPELRADLQAGRATVATVVDEVLRHDGPVQNTRRFAARATVVDGAEVAAGDGILVLLAAANRDPRANPDPHAFRLDRTAPRTFTFGAGAHRCPGAAWASALATRIVSDLLRAGYDPAPLASVPYKPSANARIPELGLLAR